MSGHFSYYPASSANVREAARKAGGAAKTTQGLSKNFAARHQAAAKEITLDMSEIFHLPMKNAGELTQAALWAVAQLEAFADAIDVYDHMSANPRCIDALNTAWTETIDDKATKLDQHEMALAMSKLNKEKQKLDAWLDDQASAAATALNHTPSHREVLTAWRAGHLPADAALTWPGLDLKWVPAQRLANDLQYGGVDDDLRRKILEKRPEVKRYLPATCAREYNELTGPDGRTYEVQTPKELPVDDYSLPHASNSGNFLLDRYDGEWRTVATEQGSAAVGPEVTPYPVGAKLRGWQSLGKDQSSYMTVRNGHAFLNNGTKPTRIAPPEGPADTTVTRYSYPEGTPRRGEAGPPSNTGAEPRRAEPGMRTPPVYAKVRTAATSGAALAAEAARAAGMNAQLDANRYYMVETVYQENAVGERRAVILMYQAAQQGDEVKIVQFYGQLNDDGSIAPIR